jgi:dGTPase
VEQERQEAKTFLYEALYNCKPLQPEKRLAEKVVTEVFQHLIAHPESLPQSYREKAEKEPLARVVCDYIAGMTDHYVEDLRKKLVAGKRIES